MDRRTVLHWIGMSAAVVGVLWSSAAARAQLQLNFRLGRHPGGSIRFNSVPPPALLPVPGPRPIVPVVPPGAVRYGRPGWIAPPYAGRYGNPYAEAYWRRFRPGYRPVVIGSSQYYLYPTLPPGYQTVAVNGVSYYMYDGVYYQPYLYEGQTGYLAVPPPIP